MNEHISTEHLIDYLHGELEPSVDAAILAHLELCSDCRSAYNAETSVTEALRTYARATERELPAGVIYRVRDAIATQTREPSSWERIMRSLRPAITVPIAAVLIVGTYFGIGGLHASPPATTIEAAYYIEDHAAMTSTLPLSEATVVPATFKSDAQRADQRWVSTVDSGVRTANVMQ